MEELKVMKLADLTDDGRLRMDAPVTLKKYYSDMCEVAQAVEAGLTKKEVKQYEISMELGSVYVGGGDMLGYLDGVIKNAKTDPDQMRFCAALLQDNWWKFETGCDAVLKKAEQMRQAGRLTTH